MIYKTLFILLITFVIFTGCDSLEAKSKTATIYKDYVGPGASVITLVAFDDASGQRSMEYCKDLAKLWHKDDGETYVCSTKIFRKWKPKIKWNYGD